MKKSVACVLAQRILFLSSLYGFSHIGSNLSCLPILCDVYELKKLGDIVILDNAHAHLAHLVVREYYEGMEGLAEKLTHGIHCDRKAGCDASGGSLGHGIGIGLGYALADPKRTVYVIVSDGSMQEGSNWEALRVKRSYNVDNLVLYGNFNGYSAVSFINRQELIYRIKAFDASFIPYWTDNTKDFEGIEGHYRKI